VDWAETSALLGEAGIAAIVLHRLVQAEKRPHTQKALMALVIR
jgi:hypothetical protein